MDGPLASNSGAVDTISGDLATQMAQLMASSGLGAGRPAWGPRGEGEGCSTNLRHGTGNQAGTRLNRPSVHSAIGLKHPDSSSVQNSMLKLVPPRHAMYVPRRAYLVRLIQVWTSAGSTGPFSLCKVEDDVNNTPYTSGNAPNPDLNKSFVANGGRLDVAGVALLVGGSFSGPPSRRRSFPLGAPGVRHLVHGWPMDLVWEASGGWKDVTSCPQLPVTFQSPSSHHSPLTSPGAVSTQNTVATDLLALPLVAPTQLPTTLSTSSSSSSLPAVNQPSPFWLGVCLHQPQVYSCHAPCHCVWSEIGPLLNNPPYLRLLWHPDSQHNKPRKQQHVPLLAFLKSADGGANEEGVARLAFEVCFQKPFVPSTTCTGRMRKNGTKDRLGVDGTAPLPAGISHAVDQTSPFSRGDQGQDMAWRVPDQDLIHCGSGFLALSHQAISA
ncbi:hypothetical protein EDB80DRAFT_674247 [Ilyonectria destructans]|nr:hypothetical protein EDB80DRAFT_674247 [Ilyonectria destructans]